MPQTITRTYRDIVKVAMATVPAICAEETLNLASSPDHVLVDLRDGTEQAKTYVSCCASGGWSAPAAKVAMELGRSPVVNMSGGVDAWKKAGGTLE